MKIASQMKPHSVFFTVAVSFVFALSVMVWSSSSYAETCTARQKADMVKLGLTLAEINEACKPAEVEQEQSESVSEDDKNIIININQQQDQEQQQDQQQQQGSQDQHASHKSSTTYSPRPEAESFFWNIGLRFQGYDAPTFIVNDNKIQGNRSSTLSLDFFSMMFFSNSLRPGSLAIGLEWVDSQGGNMVTEDGSESVEYQFNTVNFTLNYVLDKGKDIIFVPYVGLGRGKIYLDPLSYMGYVDGVHYSHGVCDPIEGRLASKIFGMKFVSEQVYASGGGMYLDLRYTNFDATNITGSCSAIGYNYNYGYPYHSTVYNDYNIGVESFGGISTSIGYTW